MPGFLKQFCKDLRADYTLNGWRNSFLFQYLKQERKTDRGSNQNDSYHRLEQAFAGTDSEDGRRSYFFLALELLEKSRKPLLPGPEEEGRESGKALLLAYARKTGDPAFSHTKRWDRKACRALLDFLGRGDRFLPPDDSLIRVLHGELTDALLRREAEDYLYNLENGRKSSRDMAILESYLDTYYEGPGGKASPGAGTGLDTYYKKGGFRGGEQDWSGESAARLQCFYEALQSGGYSEVLIPIRIDPPTGAGLYFMGREFLRESRVALDKACCIACLYLKDLDLVIEGKSATWSMWSGGRAELEALCGYPNVEEALKWFDYLTKDGRAPESEASQMDLLSYFQDGNGYPPQGCPPEFLRYFLPPRKAPQEEKSTLASVGKAAWERESGKASGYSRRAAGPGMYGNKG